MPRVALQLIASLGCNELNSELTQHRNSACSKAAGGRLSERKLFLRDGYYFFITRVSKPHLAEVTAAAVL